LECLRASWISAQSTFSTWRRVGAVVTTMVLGLGAVVRDQINIADRSFVGAGAVVVKDTETDAVYTGNPARKTGAIAKDVS